MALAHPITGEELTPVGAFYATLAFLREDTQAAAGAVWVMRKSAQGEHLRMIDAAFDLRVRDNVRRAGSYLPGEAMS